MKYLLLLLLPFILTGCLEGQEGLFGSNGTTGVEKTDCDQCNHQTQYCNNHKCEDLFMESCDDSMIQSLCNTEQLACKNTLPDGSGKNICTFKTPNCDIPNLLYHTDGICLPKCTDNNFCNHYFGSGWRCQTDHTLTNYQYCVRTCTEGTIRCDENKKYIEECINGNWTSYNEFSLCKEQKPYLICEKSGNEIYDICKIDSEGTHCIPRSSALFCENNTLYSCTASGIIKEDCPSGKICDATLTGCTQKLTCDSNNITCNTNGVITVCNNTILQKFS